jgi:mRNA interferase RelE/StbE
MTPLRVYLEPEVHEARKILPGNVRQRVKRTIDALAHNPRPAESKELAVEGLDVPSSIELRRIRLDALRLVYAVSSVESWVWVLAVRKRPPYDYEDLPGLIERLR